MYWISAKFFLIIFLLSCAGQSENGVQNIIDGNPPTKLTTADSSQIPWANAYAPYVLRVMRDAGGGQFSQCTLTLVELANPLRIVGVTAKHCISGNATCLQSTFSWPAFVKAEFTPRCVRTFDVSSATTSDVAVVELSDQEKFKVLFVQNQKYPPPAQSIRDVVISDKLLMLSFFNYQASKCVESMDKSIVEKTSLNLSLPPNDTTRLGGLRASDFSSGGLLGNTFAHYLSSCPGSSGALLVDSVSGDVVGMHTTGISSKENSGIRGQVLKTAVACVEKGVCR